MESLEKYLVEFLEKLLGQLLEKLSLKYLEKFQVFQGEINRGKIREVPRGTTGQQQDFLKLRNSLIEEFLW